ncbi:enhanced intracellular survival protein Eis [Haloferax namakaokahaiae]|uniref:Enhanced intracellular survival protein Eis n=1 Tax=Haloferax namakaokahaiae TaxID=1748331 RepID=A0ABD5ZBE2_9EURY
MNLHSLPESHREAYRDVLGYAFRPESGPDWDHSDHPDPDIYHPYGFYDAPPDADPDDLSTEDLLTVCAYYDFSARVRDEWHPLPGITAVASPPELRRQGHISEMFDQLLVELRESGRYLSALWPFEYEFYRRFGWATSNNYAQTKISPDDLADVVPDPDGEFVRLEADDWERVDGLYRTASTEDLALDPTEGWWRYRVFRGWESDPYVYGWERDGELRGNLIFRIEGDWDSRSMTVVALVAVDSEARGHLLRFLRDHDSQVDEITIGREHESTRLIDDLPDPRAATVEIKPGPMVRIVDVQAALEAVSLDETTTDSLVIDVTDDRCAWNDQTLRLDVDAGSTTVTQTDADADATVEIGALSQLLVGARTAESLSRTAYLSAHTAGALDTLDSVFTQRDVYLREGF